ncbi:DUF4344 domain-containing metallopeptidase [Chitinophaga sp. sic0106]|uniref:DUF4344 domain-containing metallopeptidase n=1 Tax=Chitinophaga sp. sic0106 TaxID=2854785 RepID=UPI001C471393|nr:DUF4344 domain-containing metallopeptidase [Chitinophaga sp. sic0106]MBV7530519.1 DUF4344 domain-containing metallopeptidase [Chitinophaga sp. sic0106]
MTDLFIILTLIATFGIVRFFCIFFHELGHALPAMKYTQMPVTIFVGSYGDERRCIRLSHGLLEIYIKRNPLTWNKGLCVCEADYMTLQQTIIQVLAGPVFSLIVAAVGLTLVCLFDMHGFFRYIFGMFLISSTFDLFNNLIPRTIASSDYSVIKSDGKILLELIRDWREENALMKGKKKKNNLRRI